MMLISILGYLLIAVFFGMELVLRKGHGARSYKGGPSDRNTTILIGLSYPILLLLPPILNHFSLGKFPHPTLTGIIGLVLMPAGLGIRLWAMRTLGQFYTRTLVTSEGQGIVQNGPYRWIRHPGYLGTLLIWGGLPVTQANWIALCLSLILMGIIYGQRMKAEEALLVDRFGDEYRQYMRRTRRLIPLIF